MGTRLPMRGRFIVAFVAVLGSLACESGAVSDPEVKACAALAAVGIRCPGSDAGSSEPPPVETDPCETETRCASDAECAEVADSSCNTIAGTCQLLHCAPATAACSQDVHCREGRRCDGELCVYDPTPACHSTSGGVCREGAWEGGSGDWRSDCQAEGGEVLSSCPEESRRGVCRYDTEDGEPVAIWIYATEVVDAARMTCALQRNGTYSASD